MSRKGSNGDGRSWASAWSELDQIDWGVIKPGDVILIDGGSTEMVYESKLRPEVSGTADKPVVIALAGESGRNGRAVIFGGRSTPLPYCHQSGYNYQTNGVRPTGISFTQSQWVVVDGTKWSGITVHGHNGMGVVFGGGSRGVTLRNVEIYDNGVAEQRSAGGYNPNKPGVQLDGTDITFDRVLIHDNGQDEIQSASDSRIGRLTIRNSWLYNSRRHPSIDESFNYCRHSDGLQIYAGGTVSGITIDRSIIGPGFTQGLILGQTPNGSVSGVTVNDVTIRNSLILKAAGLNVMGYEGIKSQNWKFDRVTVHCISGYTGSCISLEGSNHSITNSIVVGSKIEISTSNLGLSNNCQWDTSNVDIGREVDPQFTSAKNDPFSLDNYTLKSGSQCQGMGSDLSSVSELLGS